MNYQEYFQDLNHIKQFVANGKNSIGNVVGGNQDSAFQVLANNAQHIKNERDYFSGQIQVLNNQLINMTNDRNNWMNIATSKIEVKTGIVTTGTCIEFDIPMVTENKVLFIHGTAVIIMCYWIPCSDGKWLLYAGEDEREWYLGSTDSNSIGFSTISRNWAYVMACMVGNENKVMFKINNTSNKDIEYIVLGG